MTSFAAFFYDFFLSNPSSVWYEIYFPGLIILGSSVVISIYFYYFVLNKNTSRFNSKKSFFVNGLIFAIILIIAESFLASIIGEFVKIDGPVISFLFANLFYFVLCYLILSMFVKEWSVNGSNAPTRFKLINRKQR